MTASQGARKELRSGTRPGPTVYKVPGLVQCNLVFLPMPGAYDFLTYCQQNPKPSPSGK